MGTLLSSRKILRTCGEWLREFRVGVSKRSGTLLERTDDLSAIIVVIWLKRII